MGTADDYIYNLLVDAYNIRKEKNETVTIKASDGINLVGHYYERDKNAPLIIFFHGLWSNGYVSGEPTYKITKNQGWNLLLVSMRAHDESEGEFSTLGVIEQYDCKAWANWAVERFGEEKSIFFMGVSTGASIAMMSSNLGLPKSVRGIIDDCGFTSTMEMIDVNCKAEYLIPIFIGELLEQGKMSVKVLKTNDTWYGMTYHEDVAAVKDSFKKMLENGVYKADLFSDL